MVFEILFITLLIVLQVFVFINVYKKIKAFEAFFPDSFRDIKVLKFSVSKEIMADPQMFDRYLNDLGENDTEELAEFDDENVELLVISSTTKQNKEHFTEVIKSTNAYLCKNKGASADFSILRDSCDRHLEQVDNEIGNLINVPLYIGLAGTFVGIIIGLYGIDFSSESSGGAATISTDSIQQLLNGVIAAMFASLAGLTFTVINSALVYKPAAYNNDTDKNHYYDFIQRELLPVLNTGVSRSLVSFKDVLNHFIKKFGENMDDYRDSGQLLNENLQKQQTVLEEINKLNLTRTSTKIAEVFSDLKDSSEHLEKFRQYQQGLNEQIDNSDRVAQDVNKIIDEFRDFSTSLKVISESTSATIELQKQLKDSLDTHFPTINDHREVWRKQIDDMASDTKELYTSVNEYFQKSTNEIKSFVDSNSNFFYGITGLAETLDVFVENSRLQKDEFKGLNNHFVDLRNDFNNYNQQNVTNNRELVDVLIDLKKTLAKIKVVKE